jgi:hypothetical protein
MIWLESRNNKEADIMKAIEMGLRKATGIDCSRARR